MPVSQQEYRRVNDVLSNKGALGVPQSEFDRVNQILGMGSPKNDIQISQNGQTGSTKIDPSMFLLPSTQEIEASHFGSVDPVSVFDQERSVLNDPVVPGVANAMLDVGGLAVRAKDYFAGTETADKINRFQNSLSQLSEDKYGKVNQYFNGAVNSLAMAFGAGATGGLPAILAAYFATSYDDALTDAKDAGLEGVQKHSFALTEGLIEAGITYIFNKIPGMAGLEKAAVNGFKGGLKEFAKDTFGELTEENITELLHSINRATTNIDPEALSPERITQTITDTTIQTFLTMGMSKSIDTATKPPSPLDTETTVEEKSRIDQIFPGQDSGKSTQEYVDLVADWALRNRDRAELIASKDIPSRKDVIGLPFPVRNQQERIELKNKIRKYLGMDESQDKQVVPVDDKPMPPNRLDEVMDYAEELGRVPTKRELKDRLQLGSLEEAKDELSKTFGDDFANLQLQNKPGETTRETTAIDYNTMPYKELVKLANEKTGKKWGGKKKDLILKALTETETNTDEPTQSEGVTKVKSLSHFKNISDDDAQRLFDAKTAAEEKEIVADIIDTMMSRRGKKSPSSAHSSAIMQAVNQAAEDLSILKRGESTLKLQPDKNAIGKDIEYNRGKALVNGTVLSVDGDNFVVKSETGNEHTVSKFDVVKVNEQVPFEQRVTKAFDKVSGKANVRAFLSDFRKEFPDLSKEELDTKLLQLVKDGKIVLSPFEDMQEKTSERDDAGIKIGDTNRVILIVDKREINKKAKNEPNPIDSMTHKQIVEILKNKYNVKGFSQYKVGKLREFLKDIESQPTPKKRQERAGRIKSDLLDDKINARKKAILNAYITGKKYKGEKKYLTDVIRQLFDTINQRDPMILNHFGSFNEMIQSLPMNLFSGEGAYLEDIASQLYSDGFIESDDVDVLVQKLLADARHKRNHRDDAVADENQEQVSFEILNDVKKMISREVTIEEILDYLNRYEGELLPKDRDELEVYLNDYKEEAERLEKGRRSGKNQKENIGDNQEEITEEEYEDLKRRGLLDDENDDLPDDADDFFDFVDETIKKDVEEDDRNVQEQIRQQELEEAKKRSKNEQSKQEDLFSGMGWDKEDQSMFDMDDFDVEEDDYGKPGENNFFYRPHPSTTAGRAQQPTPPDTQVFQLPDIVQLARELLSGGLPAIVKSISRKRGSVGAEGVFYPNDDGRIKLRRDIFKGPVIESHVFKKGNMQAWIDQKIHDLAKAYGVPEDEILVTKDKVKGGTRIMLHLKDLDFAAKVLAHEVGHAADWMPDKTMKHGNILGRIANLNKYVKSFVAGFPGGENPLTKEEIKRLKEQIKQELAKEQDVEVEIEETIFVEVEEEATGKIVKVPITPDDVIAVWNDMTGSIRDTAPELYIYLARANTKTKANIIKQAMKGMLADEVRSFLKSVQSAANPGEKVKVLREKKVKKKVIQKRTKNATAAEIKKEFEKRFQEEVKKRMLLSKAVIMDELKKLTQWWNPFDVNADKDYTKYRHSSVELYAEAISVLLNNPDQLQRRAPEFYRGFFGWLGSKPEFEAEYNLLIGQIKSGVRPGERRANLRESWVRGDTKIWNLIKRAKLGLVDFRNLAYSYLVDRYVIKRDVHQLPKDIYLDPDKNPEIKINDAIYSGGMKERYMSVIHGLTKVLKEAGNTWEDFNEYLFHLRVIHDTWDKANSQGYNQKTSKIDLADLKKNIGQERFDNLEKARKEFRRLRNETIIPFIRESRMFNAELVKHIEDNEYYVTWNVQKYLDEEHGGGNMGAKIAPIHGTFEDILAPADATIIKDLSLFGAIYWNNAKRTTIEHLQTFGGEITPAKTQWNGKKKVPIETRKEGKGTIFFMRSGEIVGYDVDQWYSDMFAKPENRGYQIGIKLLNSLGSPFRNIFTVLRPGFWLTNLGARDRRRAISMIPGHHWLKFNMHWLAAWKPAFKSVYDIKDESGLVDKVRELGITNPLSDVGGMTDEGKMHDRLINMYFKNFTKGNPVKQLFTGMYHNALLVSAAFERIPKFAGYTYFKEMRPDMRDGEIADIVRTQIGSPAFLLGGRAKPVTNNIILFSQVFTTANRYNYRAWKSRPGEMALKAVYNSIAPKALMWTLKSGALLALWRAIGGDDDDDFGKWLNWMKRLYSRVSNYYMTNYAVIPLFEDENGKTVFITIPQDEMERYIGGMAYTILNSSNTGIDAMTDMFKLTGGQAPGLNPLIGVTNDVWQYLTGNPVWDSHLGRPALPDDLNKARTMESHKAMGLYLAQQLGLGVVSRFDPHNKDKAKSQIEQILGIPVADDIVSRWIRVSEYGVQEEIYKSIKEEEQIAARQRLKEKEAVNKKIAGKPLTREEKSIVDSQDRRIKNMIDKAQTKNSGSVYDKMLGVANTRAEKDAVQMEILRLEGPGFRIAPLIQDDIRLHADILTSTRETKRYKEIPMAIKWFKDRGITKTEIQQAYKDEINKLKTREGRRAKAQRLNAQLKKIYG